MGFALNFKHREKHHGLDTLFASMQGSLGAQLPALLGALGILVIGWFLALLVRAGSRRLLGMAGLNSRLAAATGQPMDAESAIAFGLFALVILVTLVAVFNALDLETVSAPFAALVAQVTGYLPSLLAGTVLSLIVWAIATALRALATRALPQPVSTKALCPGGCRADQQQSWQCPVLAGAAALPAGGAGGFSARWPARSGAGHGR